MITDELFKHFHSLIRVWTYFLPAVFVSGRFHPDIVGSLAVKTSTPVPGTDARRKFLTVFTETLLKNRKWK